MSGPAFLPVDDTIPREHRDFIIKTMMHVRRDAKHKSDKNAPTMAVFKTDVAGGLTLSYDRDWFWPLRGTSAHNLRGRGWCAKVIFYEKNGAAVEENLRRKGYQRLNIFGTTVFYAGGNIDNMDLFMHDMTLVKMFAPEELLTPMQYD